VLPLADRDSDVVDNLPPHDLVVRSGREGAIDGSDERRILVVGLDVIVPVRY
jgi:hypothetical protein